MWGESSKNCEINCQCSGLLTETFKINSGNNATKRKQETALTHNYKLKMNPHSIDFNKSPLNSPINTTKRRILGEIQNFKPTSPYIERLKNSPLPDLKSPSQSPSKSPFNSSSYSSHSPLAGKQFSSNSPLSKQFSSNSPLSRQQFSPNSPSIKPFSSNSPLSKPLSSNSPLSKPYSSNFNAAQSIKSPLLNSPIISTHSPLTTRVKRTSKISRIFEERTKFKMESKENKENEFSKLHFEEETRDCSFSGRLDEGIEKWGSSAKLDFTDALPSKYTDPCVPEKENQDLDDLESLQDLEAQFDSETFEQCTKYEIISTDSPDIISRGRTGRKITSKHFSFGAPISESEQSTSFNRPATRMLTFDEDEFEFPSPAVKKTVSVKKSLKFNETPTKYSLRPERSDSSIGSMSLSPASSKLRLFTSDSTTSMESGFISELEEPFLEIEDSNSPKIANFDALISGKIKENIITDKNFLKRPSLARSLSFQPESRAKMSLLSILESPERRNKKRVEREEELEKCSKRRKSEAESPAKRPTLQRAFSENNASIMSALAKSVVQPDLTGDFSRVCALPLAAGGAPDLRTVGPDTLAGLLRGDYSHLVHSYTIIDCRYPYEFAGGHVQGAINLYTEEQVQDLVLRPPPDTPADRRHRHVLVFHCEYSIQRGPALSRCLRAFDRRVHRASYPSLRFPELYVVAGGYRAFHARHPALCHPRGYTAMTDPRHRHLLRQHRRH